MSRSRAIIWIAKHFALDWGWHACPCSCHSRRVLPSYWWTDIILIAALLSHWMWGCSNRLTHLLITSSSCLRLLTCPILARWPYSSLLLWDILRASWSWVLVPGGVAGTNAYLLPLFRLHGRCRCLKLIWCGLRLLFLQGWIVQIRHFELLRLILFLHVALSISG